MEFCSPLRGVLPQTVLSNFPRRTLQSHLVYQPAGGGFLMRSAKRFKGECASIDAHQVAENAARPWENDQLITMANTSTDREAALCVATNQGNYHVFSVTPTGAAANQLVSILTGNSIGQTLQNQTVTHAYLLTEASEEIISAAGCYILDGSGVPIGCIPATNPTQAVGAWYPVSIPISLNTTAVVRTDA